MAAKTEDRIARLEAAVCELVEVIGGQLVGNDLVYADPGALARRAEQQMPTALALYYELRPRPQRNPDNVHGKRDENDSIHNQTGWVWPLDTPGGSTPPYPPNDQRNPDPVVGGGRP